MARLKSEVRDRKKREAKHLFVNGFSIINISKIVKIGVKSLGDWRKQDKWDEEKDLHSLKPSEIRKLTLKQAVAISKGEKLPYKSDDIAKIVAAFDRITDNRKIAVYSMESIDNFSNFLLEKAATAKPKQRELVLEVLQEIRPYFDEFITKLLQDD